LILCKIEEVFFITDSSASETLSEDNEIKALEKMGVLQWSDDEEEISEKK
jgi:hypothetical protein